MTAIVVNDWAGLYHVPKLQSFPIFKNSISAKYPNNYSYRTKECNFTTPPKGGSLRLTSLRCLPRLRLVPGGGLCPVVQYKGIGMQTVSTRQSPGGDGIGQLVHDLRKKMPLYIRDAHAKNILLVEDEAITFRSGEKHKKKRQFQRLLASVQTLKQEQQSRYQEAIGQRSQLKHHFVHGVITFSPEMSEEYAKQPELFLNHLRAHLKALCDYQGMELVYAVVHTDEKTPHVHYTLKNFDERGRSIYKKSFGKKQHGEKLQDIASQHWERFGSGFRRGKKKTKKLSDKAQELFDKAYDDLDAEQKAQVYAQCNVRHLSVAEAHRYESQLEVKTSVKRLEQKIQDDAKELIEKNSRLLRFDKAGAMEGMNELLRQAYKTRINANNEKKAKEYVKLLPQYRQLEEEHDDMKEELRAVKEERDTLQETVIGLEREKELLAYKLEKAEAQIDTIEKDRQRMIKIYEPWRIQILEVIREIPRTMERLYEELRKRLSSTKDDPDHKKRRSEASVVSKEDFLR